MSTEMFAAYTPSSYGSVGLAKVAVINETDKSYVTNGGIPEETLVGWVGYVPRRVSKSGTLNIRLFHSGPEAAQYLIDHAAKKIKQLRERIHRIESDVRPLRKILRNAN